MIMLCPRKIKLISPVASTDAQRDTSFYFYWPHIPILSVYPFTSSFAKSLFIGGLIGAATALLFAPKPGRDLHSELSDKMTIVSDKTKDVASAVSSKAMDLAKKRNNASL